MHTRGGRGQKCQFLGVCTLWMTPYHPPSLSQKSDTICRFMVDGTLGRSAKKMNGGGKVADKLPYDWEGACLFRISWKGGPAFQTNPYPGFFLCVLAETHFEKNAETHFKNGETHFKNSETHFNLPKTHFCGIFLSVFQCESTKNL